MVAIQLTPSESCSSKTDPGNCLAICFALVGLVLGLVTFGLIHVLVQGSDRVKSIRDEQHWVCRYCTPWTWNGQQYGNQRVCSKRNIFIPVNLYFAFAFHPTHDSSI